MSGQRPRVLIEELDATDTAPTDIITGSDSDAEGADWPSPQATASHAEHAEEGAIAKATTRSVPGDTAATPDTCSPASSAAVAAAAAALASVPAPPDAVFADHSGSPCPPNGGGRLAAGEHCAGAAVALSRLADATAVLAPDHVSWGPSADAAGGDGGTLPAQPPTPLIQEIAQGATEAAPKLDAAAALATCAQYGADPSLEGAWATEETGAAALQAITSLAALLPLQQPLWQRRSLPASQQPSGVPAAAGQTHDGADQPQGQRLLAAALPAVVQQLRPALRTDKPGTADFDSAMGPADAFRRFQAARQLAWLVRRLRGPVMGAALPGALPVLLAIIEDVSPAVQRTGMRALQHLAEAAPAEDLKFHRLLLLDAATRAITAADERVWPAAAPAMCRLVVALEGADPWATGYERLVAAMLGEAEMQRHKAGHAAIWLDAMLPVLQALGAVAVRHFPRLMPLLLGWLHVRAAGTRTAAVAALQAVVLGCWPRMDAHAPLLWQHLQAAYQASPAAGGGSPQEAEQRAESSSGVGPGPSIVRVAQLLERCGGDEMHRVLHEEQQQPGAAAGLAVQLPEAIVAGGGA